jgi:hypothetical protein
MRKLYPMLAVAVLFAGTSLLVRAQEGGDKAKTIEGMAQCAKCALKEAPACQNVVVVEKDGKTTKYYLVQNDVAKQAHSKAGFCTAPKDAGPKVKVEGTHEEKDGKHMVTATKIEKVED